MSKNPKLSKGKEILITVGVAAVMSLSVLVTQSGLVFAQSSNFQGGSPQVSQTPDMANIRILFPAGVRSSWHSHTWGQLLMIEEGIGLHQIVDASLKSSIPASPSGRLQVLNTGMALTLK